MEVPAFLRQHIPFYWQSMDVIKYIYTSKAHVNMDRKKSSGILILDLDGVTISLTAGVGCYTSVRL